MASGAANNVDLTFSNLANQLQSSGYPSQLTQSAANFYQHMADSATRTIDPSYQAAAAAAFYAPLLSSTFEATGHPPSGHFGNFSPANYSSSSAAQLPFLMPSSPSIPGHPYYSMETLYAQQQAMLSLVHHQRSLGSSLTPRSGSDSPTRPCSPSSSGRIVIPQAIHPFLDRNVRSPSNGHRSPSITNSETFFPHRKSPNGLNTDKERDSRERFSTKRKSLSDLSESDTRAAVVPTPGGSGLKLRSFRPPNISIPRMVVSSAFSEPLSAPPQMKENPARFWIESQLGGNRTSFSNTSPNEEAFHKPSPLSAPPTDDKSNSRQRFSYPCISSNNKNNNEHNNQSSANGKHERHRHNISTLPGPDDSSSGIDRSVNGRRKKKNSLTSPPSSPFSHPLYYRKGSMIELADGSLKRVEEMTTEDFISCVQSSAELSLDESYVLKIENKETWKTFDKSSLITFAAGKKNPFSVEVPVEQPFFVFGKGWSSCSPETTYQRYGLQCRQLEVGDSCVSLTKGKHISGEGASDKGVDRNNNDNV